MKSLIILAACIVPVFAQKRNEAFYRDKWAKANGGAIEVKMGDNTRCDVVTKTHAVEIEFGAKWTEGIGQALWYSFQTNKEPGLVIVLRDPKEERFVIRARSLIAGKGLKIRLWVVRDFS